MLDDVCDRSSDYALVRQTTPGAKYIYVRSNDHNKRVYNLPDADKSPKVISKLNSAVSIDLKYKICSIFSVMIFSMKPKMN